MADKAIDDLGRDQMEFAEEVLILFENDLKIGNRKYLVFFFNFPFIYFCHANSFFLLQFLKKVNTD